MNRATAWIRFVGLAGWLAIVAGVGPTSMAQDEPEAEATERAKAEPAALAAERLRAMPLERRLELSQRLRRFDALSAAEQQSIRALDEAIGATEPEQRARYEAVLRRYHLWVRTLPEAERARLKGLAADDRAAAVQSLLESYPLTREGRLDDVLAVTSSLNPRSIVEQAWTMRVWLRLTPAQQVEVQKLTDPVARKSALLAHSTALEVEPERPEAFERLEAEIQRRVRERRRSGATTTKDALRPQARKAAQARIVEARVLDTLEPESVQPSRLKRFAAAMPDWVSETFDALPPAAAQRRLHLLYRLTYPSPEEMPEAPPAGSAPPRVPTAPPAATEIPPSGTNASPF